MFQNAPSGCQVANMGLVVGEARAEAGNHLEATRMIQGRRVLRTWILRALFQVELTRFADGLEAGVSQGQGPRTTPRGWISGSGQLRLPLSKLGT